MKKKELLERIERLEAEVARLKAQQRWPCVPSYPPCYPPCCPPWRQTWPYPLLWEWPATSDTWTPGDSITITYGASTYGGDITTE